MATHFTPAQEFSLLGDVRNKAILENKRGINKPLVVRRVRETCNLALLSINGRSGDVIGWERTGKKKVI